MRDRRIWIVVGVAVAVLLGMLAWSSFGSDDAAAPSPSLTASPGASSSPSPSASGSPSSSAPSPSGSASPGATPTASSSGKPSPNPTSSLADDGLPLVTIEQPTSGASVGIPAEIKGTAVAFEAVLRWEILDSKGKLFTNGPAYASAGAPERGLWQVEVELPIGSYTVVAFVESPKDGKRLSEARVKFRAG